MNPALELMLLLDTTSLSSAPANLHIWIDNLDNEIVTNSGDKIVFNVP